MKYRDLGCNFVVVWKVAAVPVREHGAVSATVLMFRCPTTILLLCRCQGAASSGDPGCQEVTWKPLADFEREEEDTDRYP